MIFTVIVFNKTLFRGAALTACNYAAHLDTCFDPKLPEMWLPVVYDQTPQTMLFPNEKYYKSSVATSQFPLWNNLNACGIPVLGDFNAFIFSPISWVKAFSNQYLYNVLLCLWVLVGAVATLILGRRLGLTPLPALLATLCYGFNPGVIRYTELHSNNFLVPIIFLGVVSLGAKSFWRSVALGIGCGIIPYIMHAECAFSAVSFAWLFLLCLVIVERPNKADWLSPLKNYAFSLATAGIVGISLAMPILLPFIEFCRNSVCYKSVVLWVRDVQLPALILNQTHACGGGGSFFSGIIAPGLILLAALQRNKKVTCLLIAGLVNALLVTRLPPFDWLLFSRPWNFFMPVYATSPLMLFLALLAGFGLQSCVKNDKWKSLAVTLFWVLCATVPFLFLALKVPLRPLQFDCFELAINSKEAYAQALIAALSCIALLASMQFDLFKKRFIVPLLLALNLLSMSSSIKQAMPQTPTFDFPKTDMIQYLQEHKGRMLGLGFHMMIPNLNQAYGIEDFRVTNPFMPARYLKFLTQMGAKRIGLNEFQYPAKLGKELDMASVKYVVAPESLGKELDPQRFQLIKTFSGEIKLFENKSVLPPAYLVFNAVKSANLDESLAIIHKTDFDPWHSAAVEAPAALADTIKDKDARISSQVELSRPGPLQIKLKVENPKPAFLVLTDSFYPGWKARVDGRDSAIYPVNGMFRGVHLQKGAHTIEFQYRPSSFGLGLLLAAIAAAAISAIALGQVLLRRLGSSKKQLLMAIAAPTSLSLLILASIAVANPGGNFPINDDWIYGEAVRTYTKTGSLHLLGTNAFDFIPLYLASILSHFAGFSFDLLRFVSIGFHIFGTLGVYLSLRELALSRTGAALFASVYAFNPFMISLSLTFMTDVPALALTNWMFYFALLAFKKKSLWQMMLSVFFLIAAMSVRQTALAFFPILFVCAFLCFQNIKQRLILVGSMVAVGLSFLGLQKWVVSITTMQMQASTSQNFSKVLVNNLVALLMPQKLLELLAKSFCYLGMFVFPLTLPVFAKAVAAKDKIPTKTVIISGVCAIVLTLFPILWIVATKGERAMPFYHNIFSPPFIGTYGLIGAETIWPPQHLGKLDWFCAVVATLLSFCLALEFQQKIKSILAKSEDATIDLFLLGSLLFSMFAVLAQIITGGLDRYFLMLLAPMLLFLARTWIRLEAQHKAVFTTALLSAGILIYGTIAACDHMNFERAKWQAIKQIESMGVAASQIDGGPEYNLSTAGLKLTSLYVHTSTKHGWSTDNRGGPVRSRLRWWPVDAEDYVVSCYFLDDFHVIGEVNYWSPFRWKYCPIYLLEANRLIASDALPLPGPED